eukprot:2399591-Pleurochrysis_carterae.AAC.3
MGAAQSLMRQVWSASPTEDTCTTAYQEAMRTARGGQSVGRTSRQETSSTKVPFPVLGSSTAAAVDARSCVCACVRACVCASLTDARAYETLRFVYEDLSSPVSVQASVRAARCMQVRASVRESECA